MKKNEAIALTAEELLEAFVVYESLPEEYRIGVVMCCKMLLVKEELQKQKRLLNCRKCNRKEAEVIDTLTRKLSEYIKEKHINLKALSRDSGVPYPALYASLGDANRDRQIRGHELIAICKAIGKNPMEFTE